MTNVTRRRAFLPVFLALVAALFVGILITTAIIAKNTKIVVLDEHGRPRE